MPETYVKWMLPLMMVFLPVKGEMKTSLIPAKIVGIEYPDLAWKARVSGAAEVECRLDSDGVVRDAKASYGHILFRKALEGNLLKWRFPPGAVNRTVQVRFTFKLEGDCVPGSCRSQWSIEMPAHVTIVKELPPVQF